jgi:hypothetical protein
MSEQEGVDTPDAHAHGAGRDETREGERDGFRPGETAGDSGARPQPIEATTAALGDMEPSAGASRAETDDDDDAGRA